MFARVKYVYAREARVNVYEMCEMRGEYVIHAWNAPVLLATVVYADNVLSKLRD